jgi:DNA-binding transcriptional ArsR family regulator
MTELTGEADLAVLGGVLGDRSRCRMLLALADGRCLPASMLAAEAGVTSSTASSHLGKLTEAGLVTVQTRGRYRYYALAGAHVGLLIETLARLAPREEVRSLRDGTRAAALRRSRTCYDHLAGRLAVDITEAMCRTGWLDGLEVDVAPMPTRFAGADDAVTAVLTAAGRERFRCLGIELPVGNGVRCCVDWTEQRPHLAGPHGRALLIRLLDDGWVHRTCRSRTVVVTDDGRRALLDLFGIEVDAPKTPVAPVA